MALVLMCGQPCSGKSTAAAALVSALGKAHSAVPVLLIDEPSLNLDRNDSFRDTPSEKNLRGLLRSAVDRTVSKDAIVVIDSLNHIKGYRYELWCLARAEGTKYCVARRIVEVGTKEGNVKEFLATKTQCTNMKFDDLVGRFERPDTKNRWDSPLFELKTATEKIQESSEAIVQAVTFLIGAQGSRNSRALQPTIATKNIRPTETNVLYELDRATQEVVTALVEAQTNVPGSVVRSVVLGGGIPDVNLQRSVGLPELRRHRRTFIKLTGQTSLSGPPPPSDAQSVKRMFANYLNREFTCI